MRQENRGVALGIDEYVHFISIGLDIFLLVHTLTCQTAKLYDQPDSILFSNQNILLFGFMFGFFPQLYLRYFHCVIFDLFLVV